MGVIRHSSGLVWDQDRRIGFYPVKIDWQYDLSYFEKYEAYKETEMGKTLNSKRLKLVEKWIGDSRVVDIGIGAGQFVESRPNTWGYDINPYGIRWLLDRRLWWDPYQKDPDNATFWDSMEHIERPDKLLERIRSHVFISMPIYRDFDHVLSSKHFKPNEHFWYFTREGLIWFMRESGFGLLEENRMETELGREDIGTFVFRK
jgi:hypothetical protein